MKNHADQFSLEKMAHVLDVSRSGYYAFLKRPPSTRTQENEILCKKIQKIHQESHETYGSPRIHAELKEQGERCSRRRVARLMRLSGLKAKMATRFKCTTQRDKHASVAPDLIGQDFNASTPNETWVSDISYIPTLKGWVYCCIVLDLFSRKVVGLAVEHTMTVGLVLAALLQALKHRSYPSGVVHHSNQGSQYTSAAIRMLAEDYGVQLSMGRVGNAYDNAAHESFFHTLKTELVFFEAYKNLEEARLSIFRYVHGFYNNKRRHSTLGYVSPVTFETQYEKYIQAPF